MTFTVKYTHAAYRLTVVAEQDRKILIRDREGTISCVEVNFEIFTDDTGRLLSNNGVIFEATGTPLTPDGNLGHGTRSIRGHGLKPIPAPVLSALKKGILSQVGLLDDPDNQLSGQNSR